VRSIGPAVKGRSTATGPKSCALASIEPAGPRSSKSYDGTARTLTARRTCGLATSGIPAFARSVGALRVMPSGSVDPGREGEALAWYRSIGELPIWDWAHLALAELRHGEIRERASDRADAERHHARAVTLWRSADPSLQPLVGQARLALDRLRGEAARRRRSTPRLAAIARRRVVSSGKVIFGSRGGA
jgi:hypothetical protein